MIICNQNIKNSNEVNNYLNKLLIELTPEYYYFLKNNKLPQTNKFKIVYFIDLMKFLTKMSRVRFWGILELAKKENIALFFTGKNWPNFNPNISIADNINLFSANFLIWYKPLSHNIGNINIPTCIRYNEMWDIEWTKKEINESNSNLIICHHKNDYEKYLDIYENNITKKFVYIPHNANPDIFYNQYTEKDIDILIAGVLKDKHYPLKKRVYNIIMNNLQEKYKVYHLPHPKYDLDDAYTNQVQINYAKHINRSKLCLCCTSKHKYRLGKYVEVPMCGGVILGDIPYEDQDNFRKFVVEINMEMSDQEILQKIEYYLNNQNLLKKLSIIGEQWSKQYTTEKYADELYKQLISYKNKKIFIISDEIKENHPEFKNEKWICDSLKEEFTNYFKNYVTDKPNEADVIWYLAPWNFKYNSKKVADWHNLLKNKHVVCTMHHIDEEKYKNGSYDGIINFINTYANKCSAICQKTYDSLKKLNIKVPIDLTRLWINNKNFYEIKEKNNLRKKWNIDGYIIGSFQKDTEGKKLIPKYSKGPDIFLQIAIDLKKTHPDLLVILTGTRRSYLIKKFLEHNINFEYFEMVTIDEINELYNCLDLYIVSSRVEGGPRSIFEAGLTKTPIISTDVGIASDILPEKSIYDVNNWITYKNAVPDVEYLYEKINDLQIDKQIFKYINMIIKN